MNVIHAIASLKENVKNIIRKRGEDAKIVETLIDNSPELSLIVDLDNKDKHGDPITRSDRSGKNPRIVNIQQALEAGGLSTFSMTFNVESMKSSLSEKTGDFKICIIGEVVDDKGDLIISLQDLVKNGVVSFENFMSPRGLM